MTWCHCSAVASRSRWSSTKPLAVFGGNVGLPMTLHFSLLCLSTSLLMEDCWEKTKISLENILKKSEHLKSWTKKAGQRRCQRTQWLRDQDADPGIPGTFLEHWHCMALLGSAPQNERSSFTFWMFFKDFQSISSEGVRAFEVLKMQVWNVFNSFSLLFSLCFSLPQIFFNFFKWQMSNLKLFQVASLLFDDSCCVLHGTRSSATAPETAAALNDAATQPPGNACHNPFGPAEWCRI